jgi:Fe(3+) dicitrate transport protein
MHTIPTPSRARQRWSGLLAPAILLCLSRASAQPLEPSPESAPTPPAPESAPATEAPAVVTPDASQAPAGSAPESPVEVSVVGTRVAKTAGSVHVIKSKTLERLEYDDPHAVLASVPGVYVRGEDGVGLRPNIGVRGVNPDRSKKVTLMEDGILLAPAPYSAPAAYYFPLITRMSGIRVIKGPAAISYGPQSVGGAIDLVTRAVPSTTSGALDVAAGQYAYGKAHGYFGASDGQTDFLVEGVHLRNDGFKELPSGADTGFYRNEWMLKGNYVVDPAARARNELRLKLTYSDELSNETYLGLSDADFEANPLQRYGVTKLDRMRNHRTAIALTHVFEPGPSLSMTTSVYRQDFSRVWRKVNAFRGASLFDVLSDAENPQNAVYHAILTGRSDSSTAGETSPPTGSRPASAGTPRRGRSRTASSTAFACTTTRSSAATARTAFWCSAASSCPTAGRPS